MVGLARPGPALLPQLGRRLDASTLLSYSRRRIYTEEKAKVVAAVWGLEFIQFLAALAVMQKDDMKKRMNCNRMI